MQTQAIGVNPQFMARRHSRQNIDNYINTDANDIRDYALARANYVTNDKRHKQVSNALFYSIPLVAGTAATLLTKGDTKFLNRTVSGMAAKFANGLKVGGYWAGLLATVDFVSAAKRKLSEKSESVRKLDRQHPFVSFAATLGAGILAITAGAKGISYLARKVKPHTVAKMQQKVGKVANSINNNYTLKSISKSANKFISKIPSPIREFGKGVLSWSPDILLLGGIVANVNHNIQKNYEFARTYESIRNRQLELSQARIRECNSFDEV